MKGYRGDLGSLPVTIQCFPKSMTSKISDTASQPERSLNRQVVLEEDEYTEAVSQIIARDFFPSLVHLDATNEYLDALRSRDPHLIGASVRRLEQVGATPLERRRLQAQTPGRTPFGYTAQTPIHSRPENGEPQQKRARYDINMSLDNFQARYTSEDNSSFTQILDEENTARKDKYGWAWEAQRKVEAQRDRMIEQRKRALIEAPAVPGVRGSFTIEASKPAGLISDGHGKEKDREEDKGKTDEDDPECLAVSIFTKKDDSGDVMAPRKDRRPAGVDGWNFKVCCLLRLVDKRSNIVIIRLAILLCSLQMQMYRHTFHQPPLLKILRV
jgi:protein DGCR14